MTRSFPSPSPSSPSPPPSPVSDGTGAGRGFSPPFIAELQRLVQAPEGTWLRDVLVHPDLVLAVRRDALAVYYRGAAIFLAEFTNNRIMPKTHVKYLQRSRQAYTALGDDGALLPSTARLPRRSSCFTNCAKPCKRPALLRQRTMCSRRRSIH